MTTASVKSLPEAPESRALKKEDKALLDEGLDLRSNA